MPLLIHAADVETVRVRCSGTLHVPAGAVITPLAAERARDLGVRLVRAGAEEGAMTMCRPGDSCGCPGSAGTAAGAPPAGITEAQVRRVVSTVILKAMPGEYSPVLVRQVTEQVMQCLAAQTAAGR